MSFYWSLQGKCLCFGGWKKITSLINLKKLNFLTLTYLWTNVATVGFLTSVGPFMFWFITRTDECLKSNKMNHVKWRENYFIKHYWYLYYILYFVTELAVVRFLPCVSSFVAYSRKRSPKHLHCKIKFKKKCITNTY